MATDATSRPARFVAAFGVWAAIVAAASILGGYLGFGGRRFALAITVAAILLAFELFLALPDLQEWARHLFSRRGALLFPLIPLATVLLYSFTVAGDAKWMLVGAAYAMIPALLLSGSAGKPPGTREDYLAAVALWLPLWLPFQRHLLYYVFPYPPPLTHVLSILLALSTGVAAFVLLRRLDGIGYAIEWRKGFTWNFAFHFVLFALIAIPLGTKVGFLWFAPSLGRERFLPLSALGILFFTAWPEEFLFRGILQNCLSRTLKSDYAALVVASIVFGLSHIAHAPFPNWKYVVLATIAGLFYGRAWMETKSLIPGTLIHALVDLSWHILFR
jgi:uncharacterized protein